MRLSKWAPASIAAALVLAACTAPAPQPRQTPKPVVREDLVQRTATVVLIDQATRLVTLRGEDGEIFTIQVGEEVQNLAQVKDGDRVTVSFYEAIAAEVRKEGEGIQGVETDVAAARAAPGERPAGGAGVLLRTTVEIVSVDTAANTVVFRRSDGSIRVVEIERPEGREFIRGLKPGDRVDIAYTEAIAIEVKPAG